MNSTQDHQEYFDRQASDWDDRMPPTMQQTVNDLVESLGLGDGELVLDLGSGTGVALEPLLRVIGASGRVAALDISSQMLMQARQRRLNGTLVVQADGARLPFLDGTFDAILCNATFPHFQDKPGALREMARALRHGGRVWISHLAGRERTNAIHEKAGGVIGQDRVPPGAQMRQMLETAGFVNIKVKDETGRYLAAAQKPVG
jgi:ubiquinone/menaquinone biosynthesis C-methylase UbiE